MTADTLDLADVFPIRDHLYYGRAAAQLGEDGEAWMAAGHDRRSYAALNAVARYEGGTRPMLGMKYTITRKWSTFATSCGCTEDQHRLHGQELPEGVEEDHPDADAYGECWDHCEHHGLPPCDARWAWVGVDCKEDDPGAVPVLVMRLGWRRTDA